MGASGTVTGSSYILTSGAGQHILIDLGMFQGTADIEALNYKQYQYDCRNLHAAILTHAHLDHCGRLPILYSHGFTGPIYMTRATRDLTELSLYDSAKIAKNFHKQILYDKELVEETIAHAEIRDYREQFAVGDFLVTFRDAGHLLGAASVEIIDTTATGEYKKIVFSGDLGNSPSDLLQATEEIESADVVVIESTYGDSLHPDEEPSDVLQAEINTIETSKSTLLIPAFSLERTQELLHLIMHLKKSGKIREETAVIVDSPMAEKATDIYRQYTELFNDHIHEDLSHGDIFEFPGLQVIHTHEDSLAIRDQVGAKVIIAGGGMMTGGRIVSHAGHFLPDEKNRLLIVGYQGEETLGRKLMEGEKQVTIDDLPVSVRATISVTRSMSSHADQRQLLDWLKNIYGVRKVIITHGENPQRQALADKIKEELKIHDLTLPNLHDEISF